MNISAKVLFLLFAMFFPSNANASDIVGSLSIGYHRASRLNLYPREPGDYQAHVWGTLDADIGYRFGNGKWGAFLAGHRFKGTSQTIGPGDGIVFNEMNRLSLAVLGRMVILGNPKRIHLHIEGGPSIDLQYANNPVYLLPNTKNKSIGAVAGTGIVIPTRFVHLHLRTRYIWSKDYRVFDLSGIGFSIGIGWRKESKSNTPIQNGPS